MQAAAKVEVIQSSSPALAKGATFAWAPMRAFGTGVPDPAITNEIAVDRLRTTTEAMLETRGYRLTEDPAEADLLVAYTVIMQPETGGKLKADGADCGLPFCPTAGDYRLDASQHTQGTLVLDLIERETGRLVWRATSKKRVTGKDVSEAKLTVLLRDMTKALPTQ
ncbi:DUF4136 domain-containing protein [Sphingopyxis sp. Geo48]|nr:DUF4136 domain-containing protein [Sphingopyxis sp. Geo48]